MFSMEVFTKITFVIIILILFFLVGGKLYAAVFGGGGDKDTKANFDSLTQNVQLMLSKPSSFEYQSMIFYIGDKYSIRGFTHPGSMNIYGKSSADYPSLCKGKPCICLYDDNEKEFPAKPVKCRSFEQNIVFLSVPYSKDPEKMAPFADELALNYDVSKYMYLSLQPVNPKIFNLYVEKVVKSGQTTIGYSFDTIIMVTPWLSSTQIDTRASLLAACPDSSNESCIGKKRNALIGGTQDYCYYDEDTARCDLKQGIEECKLDERITKTCICGENYVDVARTGWATSYCLKSSEGKLLLLPFNCMNVVSCSDYCDLFLTKDYDCDVNLREVKYCTENPCGIKSEGGATTCKIISKSDGLNYCASGT